MIDLFNFNKTFSHTPCFYSDEKVRETFVYAAERTAM